MQTLLRALRSHAARQPDHPAFHIGTNLVGTPVWHTLTYGELHRRTEEWARGFAARGLQPRSLVFLILRHCVEMYPAYLGAMRAGLVPCFLPYPTAKQNPALYWRDHVTLFERYAPGAVVTYADNLAMAGALVSDRNAGGQTCAMGRCYSIVPEPPA